jgi:hypothetical protein
LSVRDIDGDGWQDLYVSGNWTTPNHRILSGSDDFPSEELLYTLPEGPYGHMSWDPFMQPDVDFARGSDVNRVVFEDFDGDGDLDIDFDGDEDLVGQFWNKAARAGECEPRWGSTIFISEGNLIFHNPRLYFLLSDGGKGTQRADDDRHVGWSSGDSLLPVVTVGALDVLLYGDSSISHPTLFVILFVSRSVYSNSDLFLRSRSRTFSGKYECYYAWYYQLNSIGGGNLHEQENYFSLWFVDCLFSGRHEHSTMCQSWR